jgi:flavin-dependent dehydrogenase
VGLGGKVPATSRVLRLAPASRIAVLGGGPAGSLFAYFILEESRHADLALSVDIYEPRVFTMRGPAGCNMCGGIVSEGFLHSLAGSGLALPQGVIQRGIDSYVLHTDVGSVHIEAPYPELRIGTVSRGAGPRDARPATYSGLDAHLLGLAVEMGAHLVPARVQQIVRVDGRPLVTAGGGQPQAYDLLAVAAGVNSAILKSCEELGIGYERPKLAKTLIREYALGRDAIDRALGSAMHVFLLDIPGLEFAALIPKGDHVTMCLLGHGLDASVGRAFAARPEVAACMPPDWDPEASSCGCLPRINVQGCVKPYAERVVFVGDSGVTRLYKDGIGAAYRTARAAARVAVRQGVSEGAFRGHYLPVCRSISGDNRFGQVAFALTRAARRFPTLRRLLLRLASAEQAGPSRRRRMSMVLWDMFSGSASYSDILARMLDPALVARGLWSLPGAFRSERTARGWRRRHPTTDARGLDPRRTASTSRTGGSSARPRIRLGTVAERVEQDALRPLGDRSA